MDEIQRVDLKVGDRIKLTHGPWEATWEVVEVIEPGARLQCVSGAAFVGFSRTIDAPNGAHLTEDRGHDFIGRAHWHEVEVEDG